MTNPEFTPSRFGRYFLRQLLAEGGMAQIFVAEQGGSGEFSKLVAIKRMLPHMSREPQFVSMFLDEARIASRLSHPNIIQVFDFGEAEGSYYLAMEYLAGENLGALIRQSFGTGRPLPIQLALQILIGVCDGLHSAHEYSERGKPMNVVHRDISPSNIVVTYNGGIKVLDFGIARAAERRQENTETGVVKGKFPYCSPEQFRTPEIDRRADIFSVGVVFHELLTGRRLFKRDTDALTCIAVMQEEAPKPSSIRAEIPSELDRIVLKSLEKDRDKRYQTLLEMRRDIERLMSGPPLRLDEHMVTLFGIDRINEKSNPLSGVTRIPTVVDSTLQSPGGPGRMPPPQEPSLVTLAPSDMEIVNTGVTKALTPSAGKKPEAPPAADASSKKTEPAPPKRGRALPIAAVGVVALGAAAALWFLRPQPAPHPVETPQPEVVKSVAVVPASISVDTLPRGAAIEIAGKKVGASPAKLEELTPGEYVVSATLAGYQPKNQIVTVAAGERRSIVLQLAPAAAKLEVEAPAGAKLKVDGVDHGEARSVELQPGDHLLVVEMSGRMPFSTSVNLAAGEVKKLEANLAPAKKLPPGMLDVACAPWCRVFIDGKDVGQPAPFAGVKVAAGVHAIRLEHPPTGKIKSGSINVKPGETVRESASFR